MASMSAPVIRTTSSSGSTTPSSLNTKNAGEREGQDGEALYNLNLLAALRSGDPARIHPFLADLTRQASQAKRASSITPPVAGSRPSRRTSLSGSPSPPSPATSTTSAAHVLHLAIRVAPTSTIALLLSHKLISPNMAYPAEGTGRTTPLHLAASLGREDVVRLLVEQEDIDDTLRDGMGRTVLEVANGPRVGKIIQDSRTALSQSYTHLLTSYLSPAPFSASASPPPPALLALLRHPRASQLDLTQPHHGTTLLHEAARRAHLEVIELAVARGADIFVRDGKGRGVMDVCAREERMRAVLRQYSNQDPTLLDSSSSGSAPNLKGYLNKYTNVAHGYSPRYFVLSAGTLSYYRTQADYPHACRGSLSTAFASIKTSSSDKLRLEVTVTVGGGGGGGGGRKERWFLRGAHVGEVGRWAQALRRNAEFYGAGGAAAAGAARDGMLSAAGVRDVQEEAGGPFMRRGFARTLSSAVAIKRRSIDSTAPSASLFAGSGAGSQVSLRGAPGTPPDEGEGNASEGTEAEPEPDTGPPHAAWRTLPSTLHAHLAFLLPFLPSAPSTLAQLDQLVDTWAEQQAERERWYEAEVGRERDARRLWEESLRGVVGESERLEEELRAEGERRRRRRAEDGRERETPLTPALSEPEPETPVMVKAGGYTTDEDDEDDEFFDAIEAGALPLTMPPPLAQPPAPPPSVPTPTTTTAPSLAPSTTTTSQSASSTAPSSTTAPTTSSSHSALLDPALFASYAHPRTRLPIDADERPPVSLWAVLKGSIGKDLTRISFPVFFNEPTSMLQRMAEDMEFSECLDAAVLESDPQKRIAFVAAFAMSNYSSTIGRIAKPFNPMLSETFEYVRLDKRYRYVSEQVSHHPPISACWAEAPDWLYYGEVDAKNKFMGKSFEIRPTGAAFADLKLAPEKVVEQEGYPREKDGTERLVEHYSWKKVTTNVSGFILGSPTIDHYGDMTVVNHRTGDQCVLTFKPRGWRGKDAYEIKGKVISSDGTVTWEIAGRWSSQLVMRRAAEAADALEPDVSVHGASSPSPTEYVLLWRNTPKPPAPFNLTPFAVTLNDLPSPRPPLPPTDCRLRPDQRAFEEGRYEEANALKSAQEERQRATRKRREMGEAREHVPRWFEKEVDADSGERVWRPRRRAGEVEYWRERERVWREGGGWEGVEEIFVEAS